MGAIEPDGVEVSVDENNQFVISNSNPEYATFKLAGSTYAALVTDNTNLGTMLVRVATPDVTSSSAIKASANGTPVETGFYKYGMVDSTHSTATIATPSADKYGNKIYTVDGTNYYYNDSYMGLYRKVWDLNL